MKFITNSLIGIIVIGVGIIFKLWPPNNINSNYGYRSPFSTRSKEVWNEGNRFCAIMMIVSGAISITFSIIITIVYKERIIMSKSVSVIFSTVVILNMVLYTEMHLRKMFDKDGNRK